MRLLRKHGVWLILATITGLVGALLVYALRPASYQSVAQVDVEPHLVESLLPIVPNMGTEEQVATSGVVLDGPARQLHSTYRTLEKRVAATVTGSTATGSTATGTADVLTISCTMPSAAEAQRCAAAVATRYIAFRNRVGESNYLQVHRPLEVTLVTPATLPTSPAGPGLAILLPVGALLALGLGICVVLARDHLDRRVRDRADLERWLDAPVIAAVPPATEPHASDRLSGFRAAPRRLRGGAASLSAKPAGSDPSLAVRAAPLSQAAESYRYLRERLGPLLSVAPGRGAVLLVAGPAAGEASTRVAANLSAAFAEGGASVILVDADLRNACLSKMFSADDKPGLPDLLADTAKLHEAAVPVPDLPGLRVVGAGRPGQPSASILHQRQLTRVFQSMRAQADVVIVDSAPVLTASDSIALARASDVVAVVADIKRTSRDAVSAAGQQIRSVGPRIIVGVLTGARSLTAGDAWRTNAPGPEAVTASAASVPEILRDVRPQGHNGQGPAQVGAFQGRIDGSLDHGSSIDDAPRSGHDSIE